MEQIIVTHLDGTTLNLQAKADGSRITKASQSVELLGQDVVNISIESVSKLSFLIGDKITILGRDYTLNEPPKEKKTAKGHFYYELLFEGPQYDLLRASYCVNIETVNNQIQDVSGDALTGDIKMFLDVLIANMARNFGTGKWTLGTYPPNTKTLTLTFGDEDNCLTVLQNLCKEENYNTEFEIAIDVSGNRTINVGATGNTFSQTFEYGKGKGLYQLTREKVSSSNIVTHLNVYGGSQNLNTSKYRASKLCLPGKTKSQSFLEDAAAISTYGKWERTKTFEDIFPHRTGTISSVTDFRTFIDSSMDFDLNALEADGVTTKYLVAGVSAKIHMNSGNLAGYEFEIESYDHATKKFKIIQQTDENGYKFPSESSSAFQLSAGDEYVFIDIYMPQTYIDAAEAELETKGAAWLNKYKQPNVQYGLSIDKFYLKSLVGSEIDANIIWVGDYIPIKDTDFEVNKNIRVKGFTRDLLDKYNYTSLTIADQTIVIQNITRVISGLNSIDKIVRINNLKDPARARRNWKATSELITMLDTLRVEAILIGNDPAGQYQLSGVAIKPNYQGNANSLYATSGVISHNYYPEGNPGTWNITALPASNLTAATAYYLYIKASKANSSATYVLSGTKIEVESITGYYHFPVGILSSVIDNIRTFQTTKGFTLITGDSIKTGSIKNNDESVIVDLDNGTIKGTLKFASGIDVKTSVDTAQQSADEAYAYAQDIQVGGRNMVRNSDFSEGTRFWLNVDAVTEDPYYGNMATFNLVAATRYTTQTIYSTYCGKSGTFVWSLILHKITPMDFVFGCTIYYTDDTITDYTWAGHSSKDLGGGYYKLTQTGSSDPSKVIAQIDLRCWCVGNQTCQYKFGKVKFEIGNLATDWSANPLDGDEATGYLRTALQNNTNVQGGLLATSLLLLGAINQAGTWIEKAGINGIVGDDNTPRLWAGGTLEQAIQRGAGISNGAKWVVTEAGKMYGIDVELYGTLATAPTGARIELNQGNKSVMIYDENGNPKTKITSEAIPSLETLLATNSTQVDASKSANAQAAESNVTDTQYTADLLLPSTSSNYTITTPPIVCICSTSLESEPPYRASAYVVARLVLPDNSEIELGSISANTSGIRSASLTIPSRQFSGMPAGTYKIKLIANAFATAYADATASAQIASPNHIFSAESIVNVSRIYKDGMFLITDASHYHYISPTSEIVKNDQVRGFGIIISASIAANNTVIEKFNSGIIGTVSNNGTGLYTIPHNLNTTDYSVFVTPQGTGNYSATLVDRGVNSCTVQMKNNGSNANLPFEIMIVG